MAATEHLANNGKAHRVEEYYKMSMGGAHTDGELAYTLSNILANGITSTPLKQSAEITITPINLSGREADIIVTLTATAPITEELAMHVIITEKMVTWSDIMTSNPPNGQTYMYDLVVNLLGDTLGNTIPPLASGETYVDTFSLTVDPLCNLDSLEASVLLQVDSSKEVIAATRMTGTVFAITPLSTGTQQITSANAQAWVSPAGLLKFSMPFKASEISIYTSRGQRILHKQNLSQQNGAFNLPVNMQSGVHFLQAISPRGEQISTKIRLP